MRIKEEITSEEYLYDLEEAALRVAEQNRGNGTILKTLDPMSTDLTKEDAITIVEQFVYQNKKEELDDLIKNNSILSGLLQQNLLEYIYFNKEEKIDLSSVKYVDEKLCFYHQIARKNIILQLMIGPEINNNKLPSHDELELVALQNTICMYILFKDIDAEFIPLTNNKIQNESIQKENINKFYRLPKEEQQRLKDIYIGNSEVDGIVDGIENIKLRTDLSNDDKLKIIEQEIVKTIAVRKHTNDMIAKSLIEKGLSSIEELEYEITSYDEKLINYLANMYIISRSTKNNREQLNGSIFLATNEQSYVFNLLNNKELLQQNKKTA